MTVVFDNCINGDCHGGLWGFAAYFEQQKLLFDTGSNGRVLLQNLRSSYINIDDIRYLFITHDHWDHIGGIDSILELNSELTIYAPSTLSKNHIRDLKTMAKDVIVIGDEPVHLFDNLYSTGMLGDKDAEHSLIIDGDEPKVITGCGHYGICDITQKAKEIIGRDITRLSGGFHLLNQNEEYIMSVIKKLKRLGVRYVSPTHCSGELAMELFSREYAILN